MYYTIVINQQIYWWCTWFYWIFSFIFNENLEIYCSIPKFLLPSFLSFYLLETRVLSSPIHKIGDVPIQCVRRVFGISYKSPDSPGKLETTILVYHSEHFNGIIKKCFNGLIKKCVNGLIRNFLTLIGKKSKVGLWLEAHF